MARTRRRAHPRPGSLTLERPEPKYGSRGNARGKNVKRTMTETEPVRARGRRR